MRFSASSILRISLRSRSRVRSSRLNSSSWVARSFGSGKFAASSFMCETVRSTSTMRSRFQLLRIVRKCSSCSLLMYCSPRLTMYGCTLRGPASRLPGSTPSLVVGRSARRAAGARVRGTARSAACSAHRDRRSQRLAFDLGGFGGGRRRVRGRPSSARDRALARVGCGRGRAARGRGLRACRASGLARRAAGWPPSCPSRPSAQVSWPASIAPRIGPRGSLKNARLYRPTSACTGVPARSSRGVPARRRAPRADFTG